ncbi:MAG: hypothetical protein IKP72_00845 [Clostridia bacterium]|nr:hypothetical protein [Clostridia bacterium]
MNTNAQDEPPMTACGGNFIGGEINRNKQSPHEGELRRLRLRNAPSSRKGVMRMRLTFHVWKYTITIVIRETHREKNNRHSAK